MGGKAFAGRDPPINTPRMSPDDYFSLKKQYLALISTVFERCACPIEAPGKDSYGDIDILVCEPKNLLSGTQSALGARTTCESSTCLQPISRNSNGSQSTPQSSSSSTDTDAKDSTETRTVVPIRIHCAPTTPIKPKDHALTPKEHTHILTTLQELLTPKATISHPTNPTISFALPHPTLSNSYIQLDLHICTSSSTYSWLLFNHSHGDLWNIIGTSIRPFGLTATDTGFYIRDEKIEEHDRKRARIFLTSEPKEVLKFLELDEEKWNEGFEGLEECFEYVTGMRFFRPEQFKREGLKSNDRQRLNSRGMYREFVDVWVRKFEDPTVKEDGTEEPCLTGREDLIVKEDYSTTSKFPTTKDHSSPSSHATTNPKREDITRTSVTNEVLTLFNKQKEFDENRKVWEEERAELKEKWYAKERRREVYNEEKVYADAWIVWLVDGNSRGG